MRGRCQLNPSGQDPRGFFSFEPDFVCPVPPIEVSLDVQIISKAVEAHRDVLQTPYNC